MDTRLAGRVALVTGASRGLGYAAAQALADEGARVFAIARSRKRLEKLVASRPDAISAHVCDLRDIAAVEALPRLAVETCGGLDVLVNNAGIAPAESFMEMTATGLEDVLAVNVVVPAVLSREAGRIFAAKGGGKIINIASISGIRGKALLVSYSASKGALVQMTKALAAEWARYNIQVNGIAPGAFVTEAQGAVINDPDLNRRRLSKIPARRWGAPEEIGPCVCLLASPASDFITGTILTVDGGETAKI